MHILDLWYESRPLDFVNSGHMNFLLDDMRCNAGDELILVLNRWDTDLALSLHSLDQMYPSMDLQPYRLSQRLSCALEPFQDFLTKATN